MASFIHAHQNLGKGDIVVVQCSHQCNVFLLDDANFEAYKKRSKFVFFGGLAKVFPVKMPVPAQGHWNIVIDLGGKQAEIKHQISYIRQNQPQPAQAQAR